MAVESKLIWLQHRADHQVNHEPALTIIGGFIAGLCSKLMALFRQVSQPPPFPPFPFFPLFPFWGLVRLKPARPTLYTIKSP